MSGRVVGWNGGAGERHGYAQNDLRIDLSYRARVGGAAGGQAIGTWHSEDKH